MTEQALPIAGVISRGLASTSHPDRPRRGQNLRVPTVHAQHQAVTLQWCLTDDGKLEMRWLLTAQES